MSESSKKALPAPAPRKRRREPRSVPPALRAEQGEAVELPRVVAPSLEGLSAVLPPPEDLTLERVQARFTELSRPFATERARGVGERLRWGDGVQLNRVGYRMDGRLLPFSVTAGQWGVLAPEPRWPGLYEALVDQVPGEGLVVEVRLPDTYPAELLRGEPARLLVHIQAAREVQYPSPRDAGFLSAFGRGSTVEEATQGLPERSCSSVYGRWRYLKYPPWNTPPRPISPCRARFSASMMSRASRCNSPIPARARRCGAACTTSPPHWARRLARWPSR